MTAMSESSERLEAELSLLEAMYPSCITYSPQSRDLHYRSASHAAADLTVRLPDSYLESGVPSLISARDATKNDIRDQMKRAIQGLNLVEGEEVLDQIINGFEDLLAELPAATLQQPAAMGLAGEDGNEDDPTSPASKTVIVWLHHLLATSKRKLAITPTTTARPTAIYPPGHASAQADSLGISGVTKPGYPGIMIFSGASTLVEAHVRELKSLNWQAFQVRYDSSDHHDHDGNGVRWEFVHGEDKIAEVESMADVVKAIVNEDDRQLFLKCVGVK